MKRIELMPGVTAEVSPDVSKNTLAVLRRTVQLARRQLAAEHFAKTRSTVRTGKFIISRPK